MLDSEEQAADQPGEASVEADMDMGYLEMLQLTGDDNQATEWTEWSERVKEKAESAQWDDGVKEMHRILAEQGVRTPVLEVYSPPRVNDMAGRLGWIPGLSLDLTTEDTDGKP